MQQFNNVVIEMKFTVKEKISDNESDMTYNISFQVSYSICTLYLTKLTSYQNPKRNSEMIKSMGNFVVQDSVSFSTCYHCTCMAMVPAGPCATATKDRDSVSTTMQRK